MRLILCDMCKQEINPNSRYFTLRVSDPVGQTVKQKEMHESCWNALKESMDRLQK